MLVVVVVEVVVAAVIVDAGNVAENISSTRFVSSLPDKSFMFEFE